MDGSGRHPCGVDETHTYGLEDVVVGVVENCTIPVQIPYPGSLQCPLQPNQSFLLDPDRGSMEHIQGFLPKTLGERCYWWCHDQVVRDIAVAISTGILLILQPVKHSIVFAKAGEELLQCTYPTGGIQENRTGLAAEGQFGKTNTIAVTTLRPDTVLVSQISRQVIMLELAMPWEAWMGEIFKRKRVKKGMKTQCYPLLFSC